MRKTRRSLAVCNWKKENDLKWPGRYCYALNRLSYGSLSQNTAKVFENRPIVRQLFPR